MNTSDPPPLPAASDPIVARLRADAASSVGHGTALVVGGVVLSAVLIFGFTLLMWLVVGLPGLGLKGWFVLWMLLYAGAAIVWLRKRTALLGRPAFTYVDPRQEWTRPGTFVGRSATFGPALDYAFLAPRMVQAGLDQAGDREPPTREPFFDRCALLLRQLGRAGEQQRLETLLISDDEPTDKLDPVLEYLDRTGWIGRPSDGQRVWLSSRAKDDLPRLGVLPVTAD